MLIQGCVSTTANLKLDPGASDEFTVNDNYQRVYKRMQTKFHDCLGEGIIGLRASMHIKNNLYPDLGEAEISYMMRNVGAANYLIHTDITKITANETKVKSYMQIKMNSGKQLAIIRKWATDTTTACK